jgi:hypothetical protein
VKRDSDAERPAHGQQQQRRRGDELCDALSHRFGVCVTTSRRSKSPHRQTHATVPPAAARAGTPARAPRRR